MNYAGASSCRSVVRTAGLAVLFAWLAPSVPAAGVVVFLNGFESGMCTWSPVANPEVCDGIDNDCDTQIDEDGICMVCGDGFILFPPEECDDAPPAEDGDGCSASCLIEHGFQCSGQPSACYTVCGDGEVAPGFEGCDDNNTNNGDGCSATCNPEHGFNCFGEPSTCVPVCGDSEIAPGFEGCDDGNTNNGDGCSATCNPEHAFYCNGEPSVCAPHCGDGEIAAFFEGCDDGNLVNGDGCTNICSIQGGWQCAGEPSVCVPN